jgi:RNA polymerase sigma-70 factor, ECF subfamily
MNTRNEADLLQGARDFNSGILAEIFDLYNPGIFAYAYRLLGEASTAEDCVSETFARYLKALQAGNGPSDHLKAYLYRIAHNWISDRYRREPSQILELDENITTGAKDDLANTTEETQALSEIRTALHMLTTDQRQVIALRFIEGWNIEEVAAAMQRPTGAVKALQHRALATLRKLLVTVEVLDEISD